MSLLTALVLIRLMGTAPSDRAVVPVELQAELLSKVLRYDRAFATRAGAELKVFVVHAPGSAESQRIARALMTALGSLPRLGGVAHREELLAFVDPPALAALVKERRAGLVIFAPGLADQARAIGAAFDGLDCLTVSASPDGVKEGLVLGFDLVSSKPRMLFNLSQSRRQRTEFRAEVLQLMTVFP